MDAKRGCVPEDDRNFSSDSLEILRKASDHIVYLIDQGYDLKQATTFVGNHFLLSERQRLAIMRSVATKDQLEERKRKQKKSPKPELKPEQKPEPDQSLSGQTVWVDGFNTIITLEVMLNDSILFSCMDGTIRDLAALRGTYRLIPETADAIRLMFEVLQEMDVKEAKLFLDQPVSNSGRLKSLIAEIGEEYPITIDIQILKDVDRALYDKENVITSDSIILDHCQSWFNLAAECLKKTGAKTIRVWEE